MFYERDEQTQVEDSPIFVSVEIYFTQIRNELLVFQGFRQWEAEKYAFLEQEIDKGKIHLRKLFIASLINMGVWGLASTIPLSYLVTVPLILESVRQYSLATSNRARVEALIEILPDSIQAEEPPEE